MATELWIAIVTGLTGIIGVGITGWFNYLKTLTELKTSEKKVERAEQEMDFQARVMGFASFAGQYESVGAQIDSLLKETEADRFLLLQACNGEFTPKWTTAVYQRRIDNTEVPYVHFGLDQDYVTRLHDIINNGPQVWKTAEMPKSAIKEVYEYEGVVESLWCSIEHRSWSDTFATHTYISVATHEESGLTQNTVTRAKLLANELQQAANDFYTKTKAAILAGIVAIGSGTGHTEAAVYHECLMVYEAEYCE